ncbi:hypothetical protein HV87_08050 [Pseudomonas aeruginosa]|nr:hypothetical protein HV87_08050 [Pseudomonas aeruginosa]
MKSLCDSLWERACPRSRRRGVWHRLRRCSRAAPSGGVYRAVPSRRYVPTTHQCRTLASRGAAQHPQQSQVAHSLTIKKSPHTQTLRLAHRAHLRFYRKF